MQLRTNPLLRLAQADMVFYLLPALMALLIAGTLAQPGMGLYAAHKMFFSSYVFWAGPVPLPGGYTLLGLLTLNLTAKFLFQSEWSWRKAGIILTHLGVLAMLAGGLLTAIYAREGFMIIAEGEESPFMYDYTERELSVYMGDYASTTVPFENLETGYEVQGLPFKMRVIESCSNCNILKREDAPETDLEPRSMARFMALENKAPEKNPEEDLAGISFEISGAEKNQDGLYIAFDAMPEPVEIKHKDRSYKIMLGRRQDQLPFSIALKDFTKRDYPGTGMARAFSSDVIVRDGNLSWPARIEMNAPLRYKGYTFYQSSFEEGDKGDMTVLSAVENRGRLFPYTGAALIAAGLLLHLVITLRMRSSS